MSRILILGLFLVLISNCPSDSMTTKSHIDCFNKWIDWSRSNWTNIDFAEFAYDSSELPDPFKALGGEEINYFNGDPYRRMGFYSFYYASEYTRQLYIKYYIHTESTDPGTIPTIYPVYINEGYREVVLDTTSDLKWKEVWYDLPPADTELRVKILNVQNNEPIFWAIDSLVIFDGARYSRNVTQLLEACDADEE